MKRQFYWIAIPVFTFALLLGTELPTNVLSKEKMDSQVADPFVATFKLTFPIVYRNMDYIYRLSSIVDHTPPFYDICTNAGIVGYTGEEAIDTHQCINPPPSYQHYEYIPGTTKYIAYNGHPGLDISVPAGNGVYSAHPGSIRYLACGNRHGYGCEVVIQDDTNLDYFTRYGHLTSFAAGLTTGQHVARGQLLGSSGNTGVGGGPHLHFGVYYWPTRTDDPTDTAYNVIDPYFWLSRKTNSYNFDQYRWASGYAATTSFLNEPGYNWNEATVISPEYRDKGRTGRGYTQIGRPSIGSVDLIERWWNENNGSVGAPYSNPYNAGGQWCQDFEGGTYCTTDGYQAIFADVPVTHWANRYIGWAQRESIISGYPDGFHPNDLVQRGQLAKFVSNTANYSDTPTSQTFQDVAPGSTFYIYVERLAIRSIVNGYPCGGVGEPCVSPGNRPYFRPTNNVTRGQTSKYMVNMAIDKGWMSLALFCSTTPCKSGVDYADVPTSQTFYNYVETLYNYGAIQYRRELDAPGAGGRYYPDLLATRAQIAMFVYGLIYADIP